MIGRFSFQVQSLRSLSVLMTCAAAIPVFRFPSSQQGCGVQGKDPFRRKIYFAYVGQYSPLTSPEIAQGWRGAEIHTLVTRGWVRITNQMLCTVDISFLFSPSAHSFWYYIMCNDLPPCRLCPHPYLAWMSIQSSRLTSSGDTLS